MNYLLLKAPEIQEELRTIESIDSQDETYLNIHKNKFPIAEINGRIIYNEINRDNILYDNNEKISFFEIEEKFMNSNLIRKIDYDIESNSNNFILKLIDENLKKIRRKYFSSLNFGSKDGLLNIDQNLYKEYKFIKVNVDGKIIFVVNNKNILLLSNFSLQSKNIIIFFNFISLPII